MHEAIRGLGAELVAISPQTQDRSAEVKAKHRLEFPVLADAGNEYARQLSLAFSLAQDLREVYTSLGADLSLFNGDDSWELPLSARIVIDSTGTIRDLNADPDYTRRPEPEATLEVLRGIS